MTSFDMALNDGARENWIVAEDELVHKKPSLSSVDRVAVHSSSARNIAFASPLEILDERRRLFIANSITSEGKHRRHKAITIDVFRRSAAKLALYFALFCFSVTASLLLATQGFYIFLVPAIFAVFMSGALSVIRALKFLDQHRLLLDQR